MNVDESGWSSWGKHVIKELERLNKNLENLEERMSSSNEKMKIDIAMLQVKSAVWGASAGMIPVVVMLLMKLIK